MIWLAVALCILISFTFTGIEAGLMSVNPVRLRYHVDQGDRAAIRLDDLLKRPERLLVTVLVVHNFMKILAIGLIAYQLRGLGVAGYVATLAVALPIYVVGVEMIAKSLFRRFPYRALAGVASLLSLVCHVLSPLLACFAWLGRLLFAKQAPEQKKIFVARDEFKYLTSEIERQGTLTPIERQMIHSVVDFRALKVRDVMVPATEVVTVTPDTPVEELLRLAEARDLDRVPVKSDSGELIGLVVVFDVALDRDPQRTAASYLRRIVAVLPEEDAYSAIRKLRAARLSLASVVDAKGTPLGVVTSEDLINRLVRAAVA